MWPVPGSVHLPVSNAEVKNEELYLLPCICRNIVHSDDLFYYYYYYYHYHCGPGSSVGIATDYGLEGPGSNPGGDEIFRPSRPALGPTQSPVQWVPGLSRG